MSTRPTQRNMNLNPKETELLCLTASQYFVAMNKTRSTRTYINHEESRYCSMPKPRNASKIY